MLTSLGQSVLHDDRRPGSLRSYQGNRRRRSSVASYSSALRELYSTSSAVTVDTPKSPERITVASRCATARLRPPSTHADVSSR